MRAKWSIIPFPFLILSCAIGDPPGPPSTTAAADARVEAPFGQAGDWELLFHDEFDRGRLDRTKWVTCHWWDDEGCTIATNAELEWYRPENVKVSDGNLILRAEERAFVAPDGRRFPYTSGMVSTGRLQYDRNVPPKFAASHFYVEMRAKVPVGRGLWPAIWLLPANHEHPPEIDVMEIIGQQPNVLHMTFHYLDQEGGRHRFRQRWISPKPLTDWHVFAVDWREDSIAWYVDGVQRGIMRGGDGKIPSEPMYIVANLAVGGEWPGAPDEGTPFPTDFKIDYVRAWARR